MFEQDIPTALHVAVVYWAFVQIRYYISDALDPDSFSGDITVYPENIAIATPRHEQYRPFIRAMLIHMFKPFLDNNVRMDPLFALTDYPKEEQANALMHYAQRLTLLSESNKHAVDLLDWN